MYASYIFSALHYTKISFWLKFLLQISTNNCWHLLIIVVQRQIIYEERFVLIICLHIYYWLITTYRAFTKWCKVIVDIYMWNCPPWWHWHTYCNSFLMSRQTVSPAALVGLRNCCLMFMSIQLICWFYLFPTFPNHGKN